MFSAASGRVSDGVKDINSALPGGGNSSPTPAQVKQRVASHGASSKEQVQEMVRLHLGLREIPEPNDAADALAVAICHQQAVHIDELVGRGD